MATKQLGVSNDHFLHVLLDQLDVVVRCIHLTRHLPNEFQAYLIGQNGRNGR